MTDNTRFNVGYAIAAIFAIFLIQHWSRPSVRSLSFLTANISTAEAG
jgi:hypothetical protein